MRFEIKSLILFLVLFTFFFTGCAPDKEVLTPSGKYESGIFVTNEGNFSDSDGSVSYYDTDSSKVYPDIFAAENNREINGLIQLIRMHEENAYIITNVADKIEVVQAGTFTSVASITPSDTSELQNPVDFAAVGDKGYVANWGPVNAAFGPDPQSFITILNLNNHTISDTIQLPVRPQQMLAVGNKIYVAGSSSNLVYIIDAQSDAIADSIEVSKAPYSFTIDKNGKVWVLCTGDFMAPEGNLVRINPATNAVEATILLTGQSPNGKTAINGSGDQIYYLTSTGYNPSTDQVFALPIDATAVSTDPVVSGSNFYGIGINPENNELLVADNNAFQGNGTVIVYQSDGTKIRDFSVGRAPSGFLFR